ncbi:MAG: L-aspartate oxidase [Clostridiales bacterium]|jgi:L-aspartate oxidase|nr:L-aspartate oxidase [Clostridiales bacterium]
MAMRRFAFHCDLEKVEKIYSDVVIVGSGIAGLYTALNVDDHLFCVIFSKDKKEACNTYLAQGGIAAVTQKDDSFEFHYKDTLYAGAGLCDEEAVRVLVTEGPREIKRLISFGIHFDMDDNCNLHATREGGHTRNRILHCGGDATGKEVVQKLTGLVVNKPNVTLKDDICLIDIITHRGRAEGVLVYEKGYKLYISPNIVICSGGIGQIYQYTTNSQSATGDGIAAAIRAGAKCENMEFVQFHPTALFQTDTSQRFFLISEAVRGEGGILRNVKGERFMVTQHPMGDLAPRDIVAREIFKEIQKSNTSHVYLDITSKSKHFLMQRFPTIYHECKKRDIDISKQWIPVCPVQHYFMGGVKTDLNGMSSIVGLYVCGEAACTGVHGANRLASNSLLEGLVFSRRCAQHINRQAQSLKSFVSHINTIQYNDCTDKKILQEINTAAIRQKIKEVMSKYGGIIRNQKGLSAGLEIIDEILAQFENAYLSTPKDIEAFNMAIIAKKVLVSALRRKQCVGAHYRDDIIQHKEEKVC